MKIDPKTAFGNKQLIAKNVDPNQKEFQLRADGKILSRAGFYEITCPNCYEELEPEFEDQSNFSDIEEEEICPNCKSKLITKISIY